MDAFRKRIASYPKGTIIANEWRVMMGREPWWAEMGVALAALGWVAWNATMAGNFADRPSFTAAAALAPDWVWQGVGLVISVAQIGVLIINRRTWRRAACSAAAWWWSMLLLAVVSVDYHAPGVPLYTWPVVVNLFSVLRLRRDIP